ncbi:histone acetyltransferase hac1 [Phtheirospermum japonicum]|uniref:histone acetyltransferase n=1 Tax=Phtheirospermum japonicum TaxID=374723 RepID=A0A830BWY0_9LAMI|nr:histone acetyltransferase hac1 [Phtheirospermum japonicum]
MNLQTHHSGQISGQVPNQAGTMLPGLPQQNGNTVPNQMQNPSARLNAPSMDPEFVQIRKHMQGKIWEFLMQRCRQSHEVPNRKLVDIVKRLEEGLFRSATTKEEYMNLATLEQRLHVLIKRPSMSNHNQQLSHANASPPIGTMIPTPGFQQTVTSSVDSPLVAFNSSNTIASSTVNSGNFMPTRNGPSGSVHGGSFSSPDGTLAGGYQQSSSAFLGNNGGNRMMSSMGSQRMTTQMIPTPGINNSNSNDVNTNANNQTFIKVEPAVESTSASQPMMQKQNVGGQNSRILHNIGGHMSGGIRSTMQQKSLGLSNRSVNGGLGMMAKNTTVMHGPGTTEGHLTGTASGNSTKPSQQQFDQYQRPVKQGDGYGTSDASGSGNMCVPMTSAGSMVNTNQGLNITSMQSTPSNQSNVYPTQLVTTMEPQSIDQPANTNFQSQHLQHQQFQHPSHHFQHRQLAQHQVQQKNQMQNQHLVKCDSFNQSQISSNIVPEAKSGIGTDHLDAESNSLHFSEMQNQFQHNSLEENSGASLLLSHPSGPQDVSSSRAQPSEQMRQLLHPQQFGGNPQNDLAGLSDSIKPDAALNQGVRDEFHHRLTGQDVAQPNNLSSEESVMGQSDTSQSAEGRSNNITREKQFKNQQRWLLFLRHARRCPAPEGKCHDSNCLTVQKLLKHMEHCNFFQCTYPRCRATRVLVNHHRRCRDESCPVCIPVKNFVQAQLKQLARSDLNTGLPISVNGSCDSHDTADIVGRSTPNPGPLIAETPEDLQPPTKRTKIEQGSRTLVSESECSVAMASNVNDCHVQEAHHIEQHQVSHIPMKSEITNVKMEVPGSAGQLSPKNMEMKKETIDDAYIHSPEVDPVAPDNPTGVGVPEAVETDNEMGQAKLEITSVQPDNTAKSGKPKINGVSMIELFTPEQVRQHIMGLRQWIGQSRAKAERNQAMEHSMSENSCQLCAVEKLTFEPPPIYCTPCGARIKRNAMYYTAGAGETRHCFCIPCYNESRGDTIVVDGATIPKARVEKKKNDEETEEWWVQCDKCEAWQHQICALFNGRRNDGGQAEYTCPNCYIEEVERGERLPLPHSAVLGAKDLPRTNLSDHLEQRLFAKLKQERQDRARSIFDFLYVVGKILKLSGYAEFYVPGAEALVVRVVSSVDKKLDVKPRFLDIFREENYPTEFPYKSKSLDLNVCSQIIAESTSLTWTPSTDSFVKNISVTILSSNTLTYTCVQIGYLEYCKMRGFASCYIWACPPLKGEDYILYCHPEIQKTPKSDKLREWYLAMLRKAKKENIVVDLTNLYEHFFVTTGESKAKVTAARLPYFDGDYWPGAAEDIIYQLQQEDDGRKSIKKGTIKKITKRALKASGQTDLSGNASKDLMCYDAERKRDDRERHPIFQKDKHALYPVEINGIPDDTKDNEVLESEFFDTRQAFLSLCQGNHYQYDTLRRAKHSSMMVLYHLHNPTAPAFVTTCVVCHLDIEAGQGWRCETCPDYDLRKMLDLLVHASQCRSPLCQYPNCRKSDSRRRAAVMEMMRQRAAEVAGSS